MRRGKKEARSHFERARDDFKGAKGERRTTERISPCPYPTGPDTTCGAPMTCVREYRKPSSYRFTGICASDPAHNLERFGYFTTEEGGA